MPGTAAATSFRRIRLPLRLTHDPSSGLTPAEALLRPCRLVRERHMSFSIAQHRPRSGGQLRHTGKDGFGIVCARLSVRRAGCGIGGTLARRASAAPLRTRRRHRHTCQPAAVSRRSANEAVSAERMMPHGLALRPNARLQLPNACRRTLGHPTDSPVALASRVLRQQVIQPARSAKCSSAQRGRGKSAHPSISH